MTDTPSRRFYLGRRKAFMKRLKAWLETDAGAVSRRTIEAAETLEEPEYSIACDAAWDLAEMAFIAAHPDEAQP